MHKKIKKGILFWGSITIVTFVLTYVTAVSKATGEEIKINDELTIVYEESYSNAVTAKDLLEKDEYEKVQEKIDLGRISIAKLKSLTDPESPESISGNTWSVMLDETQEELFKMVSENISILNTFKGNSEEKKNLISKTENIIVTLENSSVRETKIRANALKVEFDKLKNK